MNRGQVQALSEVKWLSYPWLMWPCRIFDHKGPCVGQPTCGRATTDNTTVRTDNFSWISTQNVRDRVLRTLSLNGSARSKVHSTIFLKWSELLIAKAPVNSNPPVRG